jgi:REP element-mobilizing transposase RayT
LKVKSEIKVRAVGLVHITTKNFYMANTYHQIYLQIVFAVKYRNAVISKNWNNKLFGVIGGLINEAGCKTIIVNGVEDHVHCFVGLKPVVAVSELMKSIKAKSSKYINDNALTAERFEWQEGYGVFSYSQSQVDRVYKYIQNQEAHHKKQTFMDEYLTFLKKFKIEYNEQYIFKELV